MIAMTLSERTPKLGVFFELTKFRISVASTLTAAMGYLGAGGRPGWAFAGTLLGTLLLAMAASALNEIQERDRDARMPRTRFRPLPRGAIQPGTAVTFSTALALAGLATLGTAGGLTAAGLGLLALVWYNGLYTPLKRISAFAVVPGSLIGALPPAIGWTAAGGALQDPAILALAFVFFLWQVPHFWILALLHHEGYAQGGFPTLRNHVAEPQAARLIVTWTWATVAASSLLPLWHAVLGRPALLLLGFGGLGLIVRFLPLLRAPITPATLRRAFLDINFYALVVMGAVILDALGWR